MQESHAGLVHVAVALEHEVYKATKRLLCRHTGPQGR